MSIFTLVNQKGGVGKTTTAIALAGLAVQDQQKVLLVDLDPHGSLTTYLGFDPDSAIGSCYELFCQPDLSAEQILDNMVVATQIEHLHLLPASSLLTMLESEVGNRLGLGWVLANALKKIENRYDHIFIDTAPLMGMLMINAIMAADRLVLPVQTEFLAMKGLERMMKTLELLTQTHRKEHDILVLPTLYDGRTQASQESMKELQKIYGEKVWHLSIPIDSKIRAASRLGLPPSFLDSQSRGVRRYRKLWQRTLNRENSIEFLVV